jgi:chorismate mutase
MTHDAPSPAASETEDPPPPDGWRQDSDGGLTRLRAALDEIDTALHELLMRRAEVVEAVGRAGKPNALRPGREASIIRRLLRRHHGALPAAAVYRIWRELLAGTTAMQARFVVAVCDSDGGSLFTQLAREQYGVLTPLHAHASPAAAIGDVAAGTASIAVLGVPTESDDWWFTLPRPDLHVIARLPFWCARPAGTPTGHALVLAPFAPDPSGADRTLLCLELATETSHARLIDMLAAAGFGSGRVVLHRAGSSQPARALVDVEGHVAAGDQRLSLPGILGRPVVLGGYAVPWDGDA